MCGVETNGAQATVGVEPNLVPAIWFPPSVRKSGAFGSAGLVGNLGGLWGSLGIPGSPWGSLVALGWSLGLPVGPWWPTRESLAVPRGLRDGSLGVPGVSLGAYEGSTWGLLEAAWGSLCAYEGTLSV